MKDKTLLDQIADIDFMFITDDGNKYKIENKLSAITIKQILDLCQPKWIDVNDHPPPPLTKIVLLFETEATRFGEYVPSMKRFEPLSPIEKQWTLQPTHWKSLEPPEESE